MDISVYKITHRFEQKFYIGYSSNTEARFRNHRNMLRRGKHHCVHLQRAWDRDGEVAFEFSRFVICNSVEQAIEKEQMFLDAFFDDGKMYNSARSNDLRDAIKHAQTKEAVAASKRSRASSKAFMEATARNRLLAHTKKATLKRVRTTSMNDSWCAGQRIQVRATNLETMEVSVYRSMKDAAVAIGTSTGNICSCCKGTRRSAKGYAFSYLSPEA